MSDSESDQSDIVLKSALSKKKVKLPTSPVDNLKTNKGKITTKIMIHQALTELKTRKGVSLHAIKKYLIEKHNVNTEKINFLIKKTINAGVKDGSIIQLKGIGASGSFKLAPVIKKPKAKSKKPEKPKIEKKTESQKPKKEKKTDPEKMKQDKKTATKKLKPKKTEEKLLPKKKDSKIEKNKGKKEIKDNKKEKVNKDKKITKIDKKNKMAAAVTPLKKKVTMKARRSIGNIIKPPKMNPKALKA